MFPLLTISGALLLGWTLLSLVMVFFAPPKSLYDRADDAKIALIGYAVILGGFVIIGTLILLGKIGVVIFVALLIAALVAFIIKLIKIARS